MKNLILKYLQVIAKKVAITFSCFLLLLKNIFLIRVLRLERVTVFDSIIIEGNEVLVYWKVQGCHKIKLNGYVSVSGNIAGIKIRVLDLSKPISIKFYGIFKIITKEIIFYGSRIDILKEFKIKAILPDAKSTIFNNRKLNSDISSPTIVTEFQKPVIEFNLSKVFFEKFDYEYYKLK